MADDIVKVKIDTDTTDSVKSVVKYAAVIGTATIAIRKAVDMSKEWSKAAADAEETASKFFTVFKNLTPQASKAVRTLADNFDLADSTVQKMLGDSGDLLTGFGFTQKAALDLSTQMNTLAIDLASFTNFSGGAAGASQALSALMLGETERAKALGIVVRQDSDEYKNLVSNLMETEGVTLLQAKAMAGLQIATEQSKNAIGDYSRTSGSFTNASKRMNESSKMLKEQLGALVNEGVSPFVVWTAQATKGMAEFVKGQRISKVTEEIAELENRMSALAKGSIGASSGGGIKGFAREDINASANATRGLAEQISTLKGKLAEIKGEVAGDSGLSAMPDLLTETNEINEEGLTIWEKKAELARMSSEASLSFYENEKEISEQSLAMKEEEAEFEAMMFEQRLSAASTFFNGWASLAQMGAEKSTALAVAFKLLASAEAGVNSYLAYTKALASAPWPWNIAAASGVLAKGLAAQAKIYATDVPKFANGGDFITSGPQMIMVGDNATGRERVKVDPIGNDTQTTETIVSIPVILNGREMGRAITRMSADGQIITDSRSIR